MADVTQTFGKYKVTIIGDKCIAAGSCIKKAPGLWELDANNVAAFKAGAAPSETDVMESAKACPTKAIVVVDTSTGAQVWPV